MNQDDYLPPLTHLTLCEHRCGVNRLEGQTGVCRMTLPVMACATRHPAPPKSYTVCMAGCNYKWLNCQNWTIAQMPDNRYHPRGFVSAKELAMECVTQLLMYRIAQPALFTRLVRSKGMFHKFRRRYDNPNRNTAF